MGSRNASMPFAENDAPPSVWSESHTGSCSFEVASNPRQMFSMFGVYPWPGYCCCTPTGMCPIESGDAWYGASKVGDVGGCEVAEWLTASDEYPAASLWARFLWSLGNVGERDETDCLLFLKRLSINCSVKAYLFPGTEN